MSVGKYPDATTVRRTRPGGIREIDNMNDELVELRRTLRETSYELNVAHHVNAHALSYHTKQPDGKCGTCWTMYPCETARALLGGPSHGATT
jgi:hypothetical protein